MPPQFWTPALLDTLSADIVLMSAALGPTLAEAIPAALENREAFCLAAELPTSARAI